MCLKPFCCRWVHCAATRTLWMERLAANGGVVWWGIGEGIAIKRLQINLIKDFFNYSTAASALPNVVCNIKTDVACDLLIKIKYYICRNKQCCTGGLRYIICTSVLQADVKVVGGWRSLWFRRYVLAVYATPVRSISPFQLYSWSLMRFIEISKNRRRWGNS